MTEPLQDPTPQLFQPDAQYAVAAQQEQISQLRDELVRAGDRNVWLSACMRQLQDQATAEIARLSSELSVLKGENEALTVKLSLLDPDAPKVSDDQPPETGSEE